MDLNTKQQAFAVRVAALIYKIAELGYACTLGEAWRPPETAAAYAKEGKGIVNSNHCIRLAIDLVLFKDSKLCDFTFSSYLPVGEAWERMSDGDCQCMWGGRWGDTDHFSFLFGSTK